MALLYGTQFFRAPNPPREMRRKMLETIAREHRFNIIRIYPSWDYFNPAPGVYDFEELDEVMGFCDSLQLRVMVGVVVENAPYWLERQLPGARYVNARGVPVQLGGSPAQPSGGWPGLCFDSDAVREEAGRFIEALVGAVLPHPSLHVYDVWNEPRLAAASARDLFAMMPDRIFCYCEHSKRAFRRWLEQKHRTVAELNEAWVRRFTSFEEVNPPTYHGTYADWLDWRRFAIDSQTSQMEFRVRLLRSLDPGHLVESHAGHLPPLDESSLLATDGYALADLCDVWGASLFPHGSGYTAATGAARLDVVRSNAAGREFWLSELQAGHGNEGLKRSQAMKSSDIRLWNWLAMVEGAKAIIYWNYHAEATGREASGFGLVDRAGRPTEGSIEAVRTWQVIKAHEEILSAYRPDPKVAILFHRDAALLDFAMEGNEARVTASNLGYHRAVWEADAMANFVPPRDVSSRYSLLLVPWHLMGDAETLTAVRLFAEEGGIVVIESGFGLFDARPFVNPHVPPDGLSELFGYEEEESHYLQGPAWELPVPWLSGATARSTDEMHTNPVIRFTEPIEGEVRATTFLTTLRTNDAEVIGKSHGRVVAVRKAVGQGMVYYFGTNLGGSIHAGDRVALQLVKQIVRTAAPPPVVSEALRPRLILTDRGDLVAVFNDGTEPRTDSIRITNCRWDNAVDLYSSSGLPIIDGRFTVTVPPGDVCVFSLRRGGM